MSKDRKSKLDEHAERLDDWLTPVDQGGKGFTFAQAREQLLLDGCSVAISTLSDWWGNRLEEKKEQYVLDRLRKTAASHDRVRDALNQNPGPTLETIAELHREIAFTLTTSGMAEPSLLKMADKFSKRVVDFARVNISKTTAEAALKRADALVEKMQRAREELKKLRDPKVQTSEEERKAIVDKVDEVLGLK